MDWSGFTPAERRSILKVQRRLRRRAWWHRLWRSLTGS